MQTNEAQVTPAAVPPEADIAREARALYAASATPRLAAIDAEGFDVMLDKRLVRFPFDVPVSRTEDVRAQMAALARRARQAVLAGP